MGVSIQVWLDYLIENSSGGLNTSLLVYLIERSNGGLNTTVWLVYLIERPSGGLNTSFVSLSHRTLQWGSEYKFG